MKREGFLKEILRGLSYLKSKVELNNSVNYYDINITSESFYCDFLNLIYGYNLKNVNLITKNYKAIDLIDEEKRIAIQVTSDSTSTKIKETIRKFEEAGQYKKVEQLKILILTSKRKYKNDFVTNYFTFDSKNDIIDIEDISNMLQSKDASFLENVYNFLTREITVLKEEVETSEANEVETIIKLIEYISDYKCKEIEKKETFIDPTYKIEKRFKTHGIYIKKRYSILYPIYNESLNIANGNLDIAQAVISELFLQNISIKLLEEEENNPVKALEKLVSEFEKKISTQGKKYDKTAIEYYLVHQIIQCNVFPNIKEEAYEN